MKLLIISSRFPYPLEKGDKLRLYYQIRELSKHFDVHLFSLSSENVSDDRLDALGEFCASVHWFRISASQSLFNVLRALLKGNSEAAQCAYFDYPSIAKEMREIADHIQVDCVYIQLLRMMNYARYFKEDRFIDLMDAFSIGAKKRYLNASWPVNLFWKREWKLLAELETRSQELFKKTFIISEQDKNRLTVADNVTVVSNGVDEKFFAASAKIDAEYDIVFVGNLGYYPNRKAVEYLVHYIGPLYFQLYQRPLSINIAGPNNKKLKSIKGKAHLAGWYDDVREAYRSGRIFLAPLFEGIGQQNKILEAMALGIPCISSSEVAKALNLKNKRHLLTAENPAEFCQAIFSLLNNSLLYDELSANARKFVSENYNWENVCKPLIRALQTHDDS